MITNTEQSPGPRQDGLSRLAAIVWQHRILFAACLALSATVAAFGYGRAPKRYHAEAVVALDVRKLQALPNESVMSPLPQESPVLRTEIDIIGSRSMAERVYANLNLLPAVKDTADKRVGKNSRLPSGSQPDDKRKAIDEILDHVGVMNDGRSYTIYISYTAKDPVFAATVANAFAEAYIDYQIDLQTTATRRVSEWLGERLVSLQKKLEQSERSAAEFREKEGLVNTGGTSLQAQQLSGLNTELTALQARLAGTKARLATASEVLRTGEGISLTEVLSSPAIQLLRAEEARVIRVIADINQSGARMNPQRPQLESQLASLKSQIGQEVSQIVASLRNEIEVNEKQQQEVTRNLQAGQRAMSDASMATVHAGQLEREANANRSIYETYLARYKQTIEQDGIATAEARIITRAMPGRKPTSPDRILWALGALLAGGMAGTAAALLMNRSNRSVGSIKALQQQTGLAVLGQVPRMRPSEIGAGSGIGNGAGLAVGPAMFSGGAADFHCAVADIRTGIQLAQERAEGRSQVIAITSSTAGEGKTFVVASLARALASSGLRVLLIDANLRDPAIGQAFDLDSAFHLAQAITGRLSLNDVIQHDPLSQVDVIPCEHQDAPPDFILGAAAFAALIAEMRTRYDLVLIDCPPAVHEFDLLRIAGLADATAFVVDRDRADTVLLRTAITSLRESGAPVAGLVLNGVRRRRRARLSDSPRPSPADQPGIRTVDAAPKPRPAPATRPVLAGE